jgi:PAS domain S-box-containing protein
VIIDATGSIVLVDNRMEEVFGFPRAELIGRGIDALAIEGPAADTMAEFVEYLRAPHRMSMGFTRELRARRRDGRDVPVEVSIAPLDTAEGLVVSVAIRDISERLPMEEASQRQRDELIATVSHELRTR